MRSMFFFLFNLNLFQTGKGCFLVKSEVTTHIHSLPSSMHTAYYCKCKAHVSALKLKASEQHSINIKAVFTSLLYLGNELKLVQEHLRHYKHNI